MEIKILIPKPDGHLEAMVCQVPNAKAIGIMCHPHSLHGGSMGNKVVTTVTKAWQESGLSTIRFNFRSVGESTGEFAEGAGEQEDVKVVLEWAKKNLGDGPIFLGGFSFGAYVALKFCQSFMPAYLLLIAPPVQYPDFKFLKLPSCPSDLIVAEKDEVVPTPDILAWAATQSFHDIVNIPESSHFFHGKLSVLKEFILKSLP